MFLPKGLFSRMIKQDTGFIAPSFRGGPRGHDPEKGVQPRLCHLSNVWGRWSGSLIFMLNPELGWSRDLVKVYWALPVS